MKTEELRSLQPTVIRILENALASDKKELVQRNVLPG